MQSLREVKPNFPILLPKPTFEVDVFGGYELELVVNDGKDNSESDLVKISTVNSPPVSDAGLDQTVAVGERVFLNGSGSSDANEDRLIYSWSFVSIPEGSAAFIEDGSEINASFLVDLPGEYEVELVVGDGAESGKPDYAVINTENSKPVADAGEDVKAQPGSTIRLDGSLSFDVDDDPLVYNWSLLHKPNDSSSSLKKARSKSPGITVDVLGEYIAQLIVDDGYEAGSPDTVVITVRDEEDETTDEDEISDDGSLDNRDSLNPSRLGDTLYESVKFLFEGKNKVQFGVKKGVIEKDRISVIRGRVSKKDGSSFKGVRVSIKDHPEFGRTYSRRDGWFDMAVNGEKLYTVVYEKEGYLEYHRTVRADKNDYSIVDAPAMAKIDSRSSNLNLDQKNDLTVVMGNSTTDKTGFRRPIFMFRKDTKAAMVMTDGKEKPLDGNFTFRTTEITTGKNILQSFPASAPDPKYVYSFEVSVDEALKEGAKSIILSRPISMYVDNFLDFHTGHELSSDFYDRIGAQWLRSEKIRAIKIVSEDNGLAGLDTDGDDKADAASSIGASESELRELAKLYGPGKRLLRTEISHLGP